MVVRFEFNLEAWIQDVVVEGDSLEDCKEKLLQMSVEELIEEGYVKDSNITDVVYDIEEDEE